MPIYQGVGGVNRQIKDIFQGVGGVNRSIKERWQCVGGVNRKVFNLGMLWTYTVSTSSSEVTLNYPANVSTPTILRIKNSPVDLTSAVIVNQYPPVTINKSIVIDCEFTNTNNNPNLGITVNGTVVYNGSSFTRTQKIFTCGSNDGLSIGLVRTLANASVIGELNIYGATIDGVKVL